MIVAGALLAGATVSWLLWHALAAQFEASPVLRRTNYRGHELPIASGVVIVLAVVIVGAVASIAA